jgi:hypothetical protein
MRERLRRVDRCLNRLDERFERAGVPVADASDWLDLDGAAAALGVPVTRLRGIPPGMLRRVQDREGVLGVSRQSLNAELEWRATASPMARFWRRIGNALGSISEACMRSTA